MPQSLKIIYQVAPDAEALAAHAAQYFVEQAERSVAARGRARIAFSGGSTPKAAFALLADPSQPWRARMPWPKLDLWWVDERWVPPDDPDSNYRMTREVLLDHVPLQPEQIHRIDLGSGASSSRRRPRRATSRSCATAFAWRVRSCRNLTWSLSGWVQMDTLRLFFPTLRLCTSSPGSPWPIMSKPKTPGASRSPGP